MKINLGDALKGAKLNKKIEPATFKDGGLEIEFNLNGDSLQYKTPSETEYKDIGSDFSEELSDKLKNIIKKTVTRDKNEFINAKEMVALLKKTNIYKSLAEKLEQKEQKVEIPHSSSSENINLPDIKNSENMTAEELAKTIQALQKRHTALLAEQEKFKDDTEKKACFAKIIEKCTLKFLENITDKVDDNMMGFVMDYSTNEIIIRIKDKEDFRGPADNKIRELFLNDSMTKSAKEELLSYIYKNNFIAGSTLKELASGSEVKKSNQKNTSSTLEEKPISAMEEQALLLKWNKSFENKALKLFSSSDNTSKPARSLDGMANFIKAMQPFTNDDFTKKLDSLKGEFHSYLSDASPEKLKNLEEKRKEIADSMSAIPVNELKILFKKAQSNNFTSRYKSVDANSSNIGIADAFSQDDDSVVSKTFKYLKYSLESMETIDFGHKVLTEANAEQREYLRKNAKDPSAPSTPPSSPKASKSSKAVPQNNKPNLSFLDQIKAKKAAGSPASASKSFLEQIKEKSNKEVKDAIPKMSFLEQIKNGRKDPEAPRTPPKGKEGIGKY